MHTHALTYIFVSKLTVFVLFYQDISETYINGQTEIKKNNNNKFLSCKVRFFLQNLCTCSFVRNKCADLLNTMLKNKSYSQIVLRGAAIY